MFKKASFLTFLLCLLSIVSAFDGKDRKLLRQEFAKLDTLFASQVDNDFKEALKISMQQQEIANMLQIDTLEIAALIHKAASLGQLGIFDMALKEAYLGLNKLEKCPHYDFQKKLLNMIATCYQSMADYKQSNVYFLRMKAFMLQKKQDLDTLKINSEIAFNLIGLGEWDKGFPLMEQNLKMAKQLNELDIILYSLDNMANVLAEAGRNEEALKYQLELFNYKEVWDDNYTKTGVYEHFSEIYFKLGQLDNAQKYLDSTWKYANLIQSNDWLFECYKLQSMIDEKKGNFSNALANHKKYLALKDSVYKEQYNVTMASMSTFYELETKQNQIFLLEKDNALKSSQRNTIVWVGIFALAMLAAFFITKHQREKQRLQALFSQELLQTQEMEKQRISRELHDSIGQNILFIRNQLSKNNTENHLSEVLTTVDATIEEVRNISKDLYPNQLEKYGLAEAVETLGEKVAESSPLFVSSDLQGIEPLLSKDAMIHIYRIIQESLNNALKHAEASALRITAEQVKDNIQFLIQDNGKGFDKAILAQKQQRSFGLLGMEERVKMLGGTFHIESAAGTGTKILFSVNIKKAS